MPYYAGLCPAHETPPAGGIAMQATDTGAGDPGHDAAARRDIATRNRSSSRSTSPDRE